MVVLSFLLSFTALSFLAVQASLLQPPNRRFEHQQRSTGQIVELGKRAPLGRYEFFVWGFSVPLISTLGINGKIYFMDKKYDPGNTTGAYELDPSLVTRPNWQDAWRPMHVLDEIFCSASLILPDKAGRILNIGGWSDSALYGVRLLTPDGSPGVPSHNDWQEDLNNAVLQRPRWYPTAVLMSNGSILVMGGENTNSGAAQPNLEILPRIPGGDTTIFLDFLARTHPLNLYPFLMVLKSGNIFVGYANEARILDQNTFATVGQPLQNMPSGPDGRIGGRTYPYSGAGVLLPIEYPYTAPSQVLICGGATSDRVGLDTCISIAPEVPGATWNVEQMPSMRVMACIAPLADGTFLIVNGAKFGVSGFASATQPNLTPVLYNPFAPLGQRMTEMASTTIARLYHSEATLMLDGSVLISGSDPRDPMFPQEYRHERFVPPYVPDPDNSKRPVFLLTTTDWDYGKYIPITLKGLPGSINLKVFLIGGASSTHGNTMGTRTIKPALKCNLGTCYVLSPPNAQICPPGWFMLFLLSGPTPSLGQWVRIGGDPAQLGNWPPGPVFTRPGV